MARAACVPSLRLDMIGGGNTSFHLVVSPGGFGRGYIWERIGKEMDCGRQGTGGEEVGRKKGREGHRWWKEDKNKKKIYVGRIGRVGGRCKGEGIWGYTYAYS